MNIVLAIIFGITFTKVVLLCLFKVVVKCYFYINWSGLSIDTDLAQLNTLVMIKHQEKQK